MKATEQIESLKGQLEYVKNVLNTRSLKEWEVKEYTDLQIKYAEEIAELECLVSEYPELF